MVRKIFLCLIFLILSENIFAQFSLENAFPNLSFSSALFLNHAGDGTNKIFIVEQAGRIKVFPNSDTVTSAKVFLDITDRVASGGEMGLLGLAFHPDYVNKGYFYVDYTISNPTRTRISRFQVSAENPDSADIHSEVILLTFDQPFQNHNGGWIGFGPNDGYLYIATGDGGSGGDPQNNAQNITKFLGKILRIDIDNQDVGLQYAIPPDNPFVDSTGNAVKEIYAWGLRNPWRNSFDPVTGWLWCADVGQNLWEEINIIENGKNYGWRCYEGNHSYNLTGCDYPEYIFPIWEYGHNLGCSITGGYVYRGPNVPELTGKYIYSDYCSSTIWSLEYDGINPPVNQILLTAPASVYSFGTDQNNEIYIVTPGTIYRFTPTASILAPSGLDGMAGISLGIPPYVVVDLWWNDNSDNEDGFVIERKTSSNEYELIDSVDANITGYTDWSVIDSTTYTYKIAAFNTTSMSGYSNEFTATTPLRQITAPLNLLATATGSNVVGLSWTDFSDVEEGFKIERKVTEQGIYELIDSVGMNVENYFDSTVQGNTLYYYRIFAFLQQVVSDYSNEDSALTPNTSGIDDAKLPLAYKLEQNYPNPFNPSTKINFSISPNDKGELQDVSLKVYDFLGKEIATLVNEKKSAGEYEIEFDASNLPSGIYIYELKLASYIARKKLILLK